MNDIEGYTEAAERIRVAEVPLSHLSIEVGHFYMTDFDNGAEHIRAEFRRLAPLVGAFTAFARRDFGPRARVSTCFLIDDYFRPDADPARILELLLGAADECGVAIDYLARESACWEAPVGTPESASAERIPLAEMVAARIVAEPPRNSTGSRPPTAESGWLCNGVRSSDDEPGEAMHHAGPYRPPEEFGRREHSIFLDVQMWSRDNSRGNGGDSRIRWSCPFLASIWQLLRLGMLRYEGAAVVDPQPWRWEDGWPKEWRELPAVIQLNPAAKPFAAYRTLSLLPQRYLGIEHAVQVILDHVDVDPEVTEQITRRGLADGITVPRRVAERISHTMLGPW
ncbi:SCO2522 family protein [Nocardia sp. bgisy134]|uniref:SCO2522 family protein n=1 Tax=unclassified Nocardia TaxID=2637762 RepID=UPI003D75F21D